MSIDAVTVPWHRAAMLDAVDLGLLRALDMLLREGHVTRAAERLGLSQPALSHALRRLRELTGDELFVRTPRGVTPTARALELAPRVREILRQVDELWTPPGEVDPAHLERSFVVGCADFIEQRLVPDLVRRWSVRAPGVDLVVRPQSGVSEDDLAAGRADLLLGVFSARGAGIVHKKLFDEGFLTVVRKGHPVVKRRLTLEQFVALRHVQIAPRGLPGGPVDDALEVLGLSRRVVLRVPSFLPALRVAASTDLLLTAPEALVRSAVRELPLVAHTTPVVARPFPLTMAWHERAQRDPAHVWLRTEVEERLRARGARRA